MKTQQRTAYTASEIRQMMEEGKAISLGANPRTGQDPIRNIILDPHTAPDDTFYFIARIIEMYDCSTKTIQRGLETYAQRSFEETRIGFGVITGAFTIEDLTEDQAPCHMLKQLDFTTQAANFRLETLRENRNASARFVSQALERSKREYDGAVNAVYQFQRAKAGNEAFSK